MRKIRTHLQTRSCAERQLQNNNCCLKPSNLEQLRSTNEVSSASTLDTRIIDMNLQRPEWCPDDDFSNIYSPLQLLNFQVKRLSGNSGWRHITSQIRTRGVSYRIWFGLDILENPQSLRMSNAKMQEQSLEVGIYGTWHVRKRRVSDNRRLPGVLLFADPICLPGPMVVQSTTWARHWSQIRFMVYSVFFVFMYNICRDRYYIQISS